MLAMRFPRCLPLVIATFASLVPPALAGGIPGWEWLGPANIGGRVRAISIDPINANAIVVGSAAGGIWRSTNAGATWTLADDFLGSLAVPAVVRDPQNSQRIYAGTGEGFLANNARLDKTPGVGILRSENGGVSWSPLIGTLGWAADPGDRYVNRIAVIGSRILAATNAGISRSINSGISFQRVFDGWVTDVKFTRPPGGSLGDAAVAGLMTFCDDISCPNDTPGPVVCAVFSDDEGATWVASTFTGIPANTLTVAYSGGTTLTVNSAAPYRAWDLVKVGNAPGEYAQLSAHGSGTTLVLRFPLASNYPVGTPVVLVPGQRTELAVVKNFPNVVYATMGAGGGTIWKSTDGGRTFRFVSNPSDNWIAGAGTGTRAFYDQALWAAPNDSNVVVVGGVEVYRSTNGGVTIQRISEGHQVLLGTAPHSDHHVIVEDPRYASGTRTVYFGNDGGVHRALDILTVGMNPPENEGWQSVVPGLGVTQFYGGAATKAAGVEWYMGGGQDNGRPHMRRETAQPIDPYDWVKPFDDNLLDGLNGAGDDKYGVAIDATDPQNPVLYAIGAGLRVSRSLDQGDVWEDHSPPGAGSGRLYAPFVLDPSEPAVLFAGTSRVYRSTDQADSWTLIRGPRTGVPLVSAIDVASNDPNVIWIGYDNGLVSFTEDGRAPSPTWIDVGAGVLPARTITDLAINPQDPAQVFVTFELPASTDPLDVIWYTGNMGQCWENRVGLPSFQLPRRRALTVRVHPTDPDRVFLGTSLGVIASDDRGLTWNQAPLHPGTYASEGPANVEVWELSWQADEYLISATNGRGLFRAQPTPRPSLFEDISSSSGTDDAGNGQGVSWADYDRDRDLDLFVANHSNQPDKLYRNDGGGIFSDVSAGAGIADAASTISGVWGDHDNDGDLDLYVTNAGGPNILYRNNGNGTFADVSAGSGLNDAGQGRGAAWGDYDNDGRLDLYLVNVGANRLFHNEGGGVFSDATSGPLGDPSSGQGAAWGDFDGDGDLDLYVANWSHQADKLLRNEGNGAFSDVSIAAGVADTSSSLGGAWGDFDNDGDLDLYVVNEGPNRLFRNDGALPFVDVADATGTAGGGVGRSASWGDYDHDGDLDLYVSNFSGPNQFLRQEACGVFTDVTAMTGTAGTTASRGTAWGDFDGDGDLDLYVARSGPNKLYRNADGAPSYHHWLHIDLVGSTSNRDGIGARIRVVADGHTQLREVSGGSGHYSQESLTAEFGLGTATIVDLIEVRWPSGVVQSVLDVAADQRIVLTEPSSSGAARPDAGTPRFVLHASVPNPFGGAATIRYELPQTTHVRLSVYDLAGRLVRTLEDDLLQAGEHEAIWDGTNAHGREVGPGFYYCRLECPGFSAAKRTLIIR